MESNGAGNCLPGPAHKTQITLLITSTERLSISSALLFTKGQTQRGNNNATERKSKAVNVDGVNYDVRMDRGT